MKYNFPPMKSQAIDKGLQGIAPPAATDDDIKWAKNIKSNQFKFQAQYDAEVEKQMENGNLRRFIWLTQAEKQETGESGVWRSLIERENTSKTASDPSPWAVKLLRKYKKLEKPQRVIFDYLMADIHLNNKENAESKVARAAIENDHLDILPYLKTNIEHAKDAVRCNNNRALSYLLAKHVHPSKIEDAGLHDPLKRTIEDCYYLAAGEANIELLSVLNAWAPVAQFKSYRGFERALMVDGYEAAEWFVQKGCDKNEALCICLSQGKFDFADKLIDRYGTDPNAENHAALTFCIERRFFEGVEYLASKGADMRKVIDKVRNTGIAEKGNFGKELSRIFGNAAVSDQLIDWKREDHSTVMREHRTANFCHKMIFFFGEEQVVQYVTETDSNTRVGEKLWSFKEFDNQALLKEAAEQLTKLGGEPGHSDDAQPKFKKHTDNGPVSVSSVKPPQRR